MKIPYEPVLVGFLCHWCAYTAADSAGIARLRYSPNFRIVRVPCAGGIDPVLVIKAFGEGADGVLMAGCEPGGCRHGEGNYHALRRRAVLEGVLQGFGIEGKRLEILLLSAGDGEKLVAAVNGMIARLRELGPRQSGCSVVAPGWWDRQAVSAPRLTVTSRRPQTSCTGAIVGIGCFGWWTGG